MEIKPIYAVYFSPELDAVVMNWTGYANSKELKEGTEIMLKTLIERNAKKVLANCKDMILISMDDQHWIENNFLPRAQKEGFKAIALVKPSSYFNQVAIDSIAEKLRKRRLILIEIFDTLKEAEDWIASVHI